MDAIYLKPLDEVMTAAGLCYTRYMDDWVILTRSRWRLRRAVKLMNQVLERLKVEKHPFKTYIGKAAKGFDILG